MLIKYVKFFRKSAKWQTNTKKKGGKKNDDGVFSISHPIDLCPQIFFFFEKHRIRAEGLQGLKKKRLYKGFKGSQKKSKTRNYD